MNEGGTRRQAVAWATKDPVGTRAGPNLPSLQHGSGAHDCEYLVLLAAAGGSLSPAEIHVPAYP